MKLETNLKEKMGKTEKTLRLNNMLLNSKWVIEDTKGEIKERKIN